MWPLASVVPVAELGPRSVELRFARQPLSGYICFNTQPVGGLMQKLDVIHPAGVRA
jgi:hypothetical protein